MKNLRYSHQDFTDQTLLDVNPEELAGEIVGSCFYQQRGPDTPTFPCPVHLVRCNVDNVLIPAGSALIDCSNRRIAVIDGVDWLIDASGLPMEAL